MLGPLVAYALLSWQGESANAYRMLFLVAMVPAIISVVVLARIPDHPVAAHERESVLQNWHLLSSGFKRFLLPAGVFALAYFSLGFMLLKAHSVGFSVTEIVLLYALFNALCVVLAIYGLFYAIDESQSKAFIADLEPERRATAVGIYNFVTGVLYLPASLMAGAFWTITPSLAFAVATALSLAAMITFAVARPTATAKMTRT